MPFTEPTALPERKMQRQVSWIMRRILRHEPHRAHLLSLFAAAALLFQMLACSIPTLELASTPVQATLPPLLSAKTPTVQPQSWYSIYFTAPEDPMSDLLKNGPDEDLAVAIDQARVSIDVAVYDINLFRISRALIRAHNRGVAVRVVTDSDYMDEEAFGDLEGAGIQTLGDRREGFMHNKFVVIDRQEVWTGSMNLSVNDSYRNHNNLIRIRSSRLAQDYIQEFEEMFLDDQFGPEGGYKTPYPTVTVEGTLLEVYFSPDDGTAERLVELIRDSRKSIHFLAFSFTSDDLAAAILERAMEGVTVSGVMDEAQYNANTGGEYDHFAQAGLDVRLDGSPGLLHHKVMILDEQVVVGGSYNFSSNAELRNDENTLVLHSPEIAARYLEEFRRVYAEAQE